MLSWHVASTTGVATRLLTKKMSANTRILVTDTPLGTPQSKAAYVR
ncbi:hypothetical protein CZ787_01925 [Halomonas citrativorans]|uniref:Uncharacterized protein n=1 Tax=Halomonas citrativorans TaxID=2742612 RepID=A0A1R4HR00_9GAMM|nr:hypothetical protein CZ787_01925 [Halomonas citrativorans]